MDLFRNLLKFKYQKEKLIPPNFEEVGGIRVCVTDKTVVLDIVDCGKFKISHGNSIIITF